jgi:iron complex outermembrane receptor protein
LYAQLLQGAITPGEKTTLSGTITDQLTSEKLIGVSISIPDLKTGSISDIDGNYKIENLPLKIVTVQISLIGYKTVIQQIDLSKTNRLDVKLEMSVREINAVIITGSPNAVEKNKTPIPISVVPKSVITQSASSNIIDALATQPGISQITTGSGISKPVIRGLGYNRVIVMNDGVRQEGQQWGDEHGIEIDEYGVEKVEVLKGPASLMYGSDAMAGVINLLSSPTLPEGKITGEALTEYQTNNGLYGFSLNTKGNKKGFIWDGRFSNKAAHAYQNKYDGYVYNSGYKEYAGQFTAGVNRPWGYSHLIFSYYQLMPGITEGDRDAATGKFTRPLVINDSTTLDEIVPDGDFKKYNVETPFQKIDHWKVILNNSLIIKNGTLKTTFGFQNNIRKEFADIFEPTKYGLFFDLKTVNYEVKYHFAEFKKTNLSIGLNGMIQRSANKGIEYLVPAYTLFDGGIFAIASRPISKKIDVSAGIRYDTRNVKGDDLYLDANEQPTTAQSGVEHRFTGFNSTFNGITGSAGLAWNFNSSLYSKANISFGFRAPNIAELGANGVHEGTLRYEIGNANLKAEHSRQLDLSLGFNTDHVNIEIDGFVNQIDNFIFLSKLSASNGSDSIINNNAVFQYSSGNATLAGGEIMIDLHPHPLDWLHFENSFSYVDARQMSQSDSTRYLPFTPPAKFTSEIQITAKKLNKLLKNSYLKAGIDYFMDQTKIYSAYGTETATPGYSLIHIGIGTDLFKGDYKFASLYFNITNLADVAYQSHLSRLKYAPENAVTGRTGIYNIGRSFNFKIIVPFGKL